MRQFAGAFDLHYHVTHLIEKRGDVYNNSSVDVSQELNVGSQLDQVELN